MNLTERLHLISQLFPDHEHMGFSAASDLETWIISELGSLEVLEAPVRTPTGWKRARPVRSIYHICAGNVAVSAETSLLISIMLGSDAVFKLPSSGLPELEARVDRLPAHWRGKIRLLPEHDPELARECDAVVVFGTNETIESVSQNRRPNQKLLRYGHKVSIGYVMETEEMDVWGGAAVREILAYQQLGCLSPQSYLCENETVADQFITGLAHSFERQEFDSGDIPFAAQALVFDARQRAIAAGDQVITPCPKAPWTIVKRAEQKIQTGPGFGFIEVLVAGQAALAEILQPWHGKISSVSLNSRVITREHWERWESRGIHRFCRMGNLQRPPIAWPHDGRPRLADLVDWTYADPDLSVGSEA